MAIRNSKIREDKSRVWKMAKVADVLERISNGYGGKQVTEQTEYPITRIETISDGVVNLKRVKYATDISDSEREKYSLRKDDILFSHINSDLHLGKTAIYNGEHENLIHGINLLLIRTNENVVPKYLHFFLNYIRFKGHFIKVAQHAVNQSSLNQGKIKDIDIPLPSVAEQQRIVSKIEELFSELDAGIASLKVAQQQLQTYRQSVLKHAFEGKFTGGMEGWEEVLISEVADLNPKLPFNAPDNNLEVSFIPMKRVSEIVDHVDTVEIRQYAQVKKGFTPFVEGDVIFAKITPCMENGKAAVVPSVLNGIAFGSTEFFVLRCSDFVLNKYLFYFIIQDTFRKEAEFNMTGAVGQKRVPKQFLANHSIPLPPKEVQKEITEQIDSRLTRQLDLLNTIEKKLNTAESLRQSILQRAFSGEL